ncbi:hypothetical protein NFI96_014969 [Prochilodus magdalenae]|nr:hypothetical protein NFI96_014969 [Prochilodus magdalenae]
MSTFGYRRELSKYEDLDEDELLASLSPEELQELEKELADIDPDDNVPIGLRQRDQTVKTPTGTFSREALMKYWENETRKLLENERMGSPSPQVSGSPTNDWMLNLEHPHTVPADGAVGVEVEGHQAFWMCDDTSLISVLTTVPPHTDSLGVSTKTKAGLVTEDDPLPF